MSNIRKTLILIAFIICSTVILAQQNFVSGYVVQNNNDTLRGYLKEDIENNLLSQVTFSENENGKPEQTFSVNDVRAFYFTGDNLFEVVAFKDTANIQQHYFAKALLKGYYNLYSFRKNDVEYFIVTNNESSYFFFDDVILGNGTLDTKGNFRNQLLFLTHNCNKLAALITQLRYSENDLINFISKLNDCISPGSVNKNIYVKPKTKTSIYIYAGGLPLGKNYEYAGRIGARISTPSISKNTSLNITMTYLSKKSTDKFYNVAYNSFKANHTYNILNGSLTIQENFTTGIIQPYIEVGIGFASSKENEPISRGVYKDFKKSGIDLVTAIGIEGYITKQLAIKADWRYELFIHYPVIGIAYFFKK